MEFLRFDEPEFLTLNAANTGGYSLDQELGDRALLLMGEGIFHPNPKSNWWKSGWKLTEHGKTYYDAFLEQVRANHGHVWMTHRETHPDSYDENEAYGDTIDTFAYSVGHHNGMECKNCGFSFCYHCENEMEITHCSRGG